MSADPKQKPRVAINEGMNDDLPPYQSCEGLSQLNNGLGVMTTYRAGHHDATTNLDQGQNKLDAQCALVQMCLVMDPRRDCMIG